MKITKEHACKLDAIKWSWLKEQGKTLEQVRAEQLAIQQANPRIKDAALATRWELARQSHMLEANLLNEFYKYMNDSHLNTFLKAIWGI